MSEEHFGESKLREAWKLYAIALREQNELLEKYIDGIKMLQKEIESEIDLDGCYDFDAEEVEQEIEEGRDPIEILRHAVVMAGDAD